MGMNMHPCSGRQKSPVKSLDHGLHRECEAVSLHFAVMWPADIFCIETLVDIFMCSATSRAVLASGLGGKTMKGTKVTSFHGIAFL